MNGDSVCPEVCLVEGYVSEVFPCDGDGFEIVRLCGYVHLDRVNVYVIVLLTEACDALSVVL